MRQGRVVFSVLFILLFALILLPKLALAQENMVNMHFGVDRQATYRLVEVAHKQGKFTLPAFGYLDFGRMSEYREWYGGLGYDFLKGEKFEVTAGLYFVQSAGDDSRNVRYVQPWFEGEYEFTPKLRADVAVYPYVSLGGRAYTELFLDKVRVAYALHERLQVGLGYEAEKFEGEKLEQKPFVSLMLTPKGEAFGTFEFWLQRSPENRAQIQLRYELVRASKRE